MTERIKELEAACESTEELQSDGKSALIAMQEVVDALTDQKLQMTVKLQELQDKCVRFEQSESKIAELSIENESLKRQLKRSTDENDDLITEINKLEGKLSEVTSIGEEQQKHFLCLEESTNKLLEVEGKYEEAKKTIHSLEEDKAHMHTKMKAYKSKIIEIVAKFKRLRASHKATLEVVKDYSSSIPDWQEDLRKVVAVLNRNQVNQPKEEVDSSTATSESPAQETIAELTELKRQLEANRKIMSQLEGEKLTVIEERSLIQCKFKDLENKLLARKQENSDLLQEMKELNEIMKDRGETISKQQSELTQTRQTCDDLRQDLQRIQGILTDRDQTICALIEENKTKEKADDAVSNSKSVKMDESTDNVENTEEKYLKMKAMAVKLKKRLEEMTQKVKILEAEASKTNNQDNAGELQKSLEESLEREKLAKQEMEKYKGFAKKYNMLALEMESYEKSMEAQTGKLEQKQMIIKDLEQTIEEQRATINSIKEQMRLVEEQSMSEANHSQGLNEEISRLTKSVRELEQLKADNQEKMTSYEREIGDLTEKLKGVNNALEGATKDHDSHQESIRLERDKVKAVCSELEVKLKAITTRLNERDEELERVTKEYSAYKIRAQNILQQNQLQVNSREKELEEELETVKRLMASLEQNLNSSQDRVKELEKVHLAVTEEKERSANKYAELMGTVEELKKANLQLQMDNKQLLDEQQSVIKSHRLNIDTLTNIFKGQISELETKLREQEKVVQELSTSNKVQSAKLDSITKRSSTDEEKIVEMRLNLERQQMQSDLNSSLNRSNLGQQQRVTRKMSSTSGLMPLEDLLNSNLDEEDYDVGDGESYAPNPQEEAKLQARENQIKHLTSLLSEAEQDVAKLNQQNDLLKEEIRRQQRSEERDAHINNSEYLKNVIFKVANRIWN